MSEVARLLACYIHTGCYVAIYMYLASLLYAATGYHTRLGNILQAFVHNLPITTSLFTDITNPEIASPSLFYNSTSSPQIHSRQALLQSPYRNHCGCPNCSRPPSAASPPSYRRPLDHLIPALATMKLPSSTLLRCYIHILPDVTAW